MREPQDGGVGRWLILAGVWLIYFCFGLTMAAMGPLIGPIGNELGIGHAQMGLILGAWPFVYILAAIPCGIALDRLGARRMLFIAALIMAASGWARSLADTPFELLLAVGLFGLGGPLISVGAPKVVTGLFTGKSRAMAMGIYLTGPYLGALLSVALTNSVAMPLVDGDWRGVMQIYAWLALGSGVVWLGLTSIRGALSGISRAGGKKFDLGAFSEILRLRPVQIILLVSICIFFINHSLNNWLPEILRGRGMTAVDAGYWASVPAGFGILGALIVPRFATPRYRLTVMAGLVFITLLASLLLHLDPGVPLGAGLVLQGIARGSMITVAMLILMETPDVPEERLGLAGGLFFTAAELGGVVGPIAFGVLSDLSGGFTLSLASISVVCLFLFWLLLQLKTAGKSAINPVH